MTPKYLWISNILVGVEPLSDPIHEFSKYQWNNLYQYYTNFLDYIGTSLYDEVDWINFLDYYARKLNFYEESIEKLRELNVVLDPFYEKCFELSDFEVIRYPEWDTMIPIAKECVRLLEKEKEKGDGDMVLSDEDFD
ncbi:MULTISPECIES: hypothetical protein [Candidatus Cardinium]|uniref:hypothetical protein n=1 Tax=Candidatus Cardinium TaxID=273135 RepID=UPI001FA951B2|nr:MULTISPECIES: hypothetical protein [Cardinium]